MTFTLPQPKIHRLLTFLESTWHLHRKTFTLMEGTVLLGFLEHAAQICAWGRYLYGTLQHSVNLCLKQAINTFLKGKHIQDMRKSARDAPSADAQILIQRFHEKKNFQRSVCL